MKLLKLSNTIYTAFINPTPIPAKISGVHFWVYPRCWSLQREESLV